MASRILHPSRTIKAKDQKTTEKPSKLTKRLSTSAAPVISSKIPLQSSSLPRAANRKSKQLDAKTSGGDTAEASQHANRLAETGSVTRNGSNLRASGIPLGVGAGMSNRTLFSARQPPSRNRLRRKESSQNQRTEYAGSEIFLDSRNGPLATHNPLDTMDAPEGQKADSMLGISLPAQPSSAEAQSPSQHPPEFAHLKDPTEAATSSTFPLPYSTPELKTPTPGFVRSNSASTRYSESPSPWSRTSTPTTVSSHSPGLTQLPKFAAISRSVSPKRSRPPVTRRKLTGSSAHDEDIFDGWGLKAVRESLTSSSSSSPTARTVAQAAELKPSARKSSIVPPTPPLRLSSRPKQSLPEVINAQSQQDTRLASLSSAKATQASATATSRLPTLTSGRSKIPPPRPSREGTPTLEQAKPSPIIQSNLTHLETTGHKRRESAEKAILISPDRGRSDGLSQPNLSRTRSVSSNASKATSQLPTASSQAKVTSPHLWSRESSRSREHANSRSHLPKQPSREPSPAITSPVKSASRFELFSWKTKSPSEPRTTATVEKPVRKGPAAGTGHEGYGKYARRGRSGSTSTAASRGRSTSTDRTSFSATRPASSRKSSFTSNDGKPELDDFLKDRLEPVYIGGGGSIRGTRNNGPSLYRTESNQTSSTSVSSIAAPVQVAVQQDSYPPSSNASSDNLSTDVPPLGHYQSPLSATTDSRPSLAHRRSLHRMQLFGEAPPVRIPSPINTRILADSPALDTYGSTLSSVPQTDTSLPLTDDLSEGHEGNWLNANKKIPGKSKIRKWFQRPHRSSDRLPGGQFNQTAAWLGMPGNVSAFGDSRPIAHYAIVDGFESEASENLEDALRQIEDNLDFDTEEESFVPPQIPRQIREPSLLLPSPPKLPSQFEPFPRPASPAKFIFQPLEEAPLEKQPRLQHVGRIPRVVSKRERSFHPSPQSFSRPFAPRSHSEQNVTETIPVPASVAHHPQLEAQTDPLPCADFSAELEQPASAPPTNAMLYNLDGEREFLRFSRRQDSEASGSSGSAAMTLAPITAMFPMPDAVLSEDEIWGEYDDFIDHVASPSSISPDTPGLPKFPASYFNSTGSDKSTIATMAIDPYTTNGDGLREAAEAAALQTYKPVLPPRPSFLCAPFHQDQLSSPLSFSDLYAGYGNRSSASKSIVRNSIASTISGSRYSSQTIISESASPSSDEAHMKRVTQVLAEKTYNASSDSLRFSALMTSRWLSFDRVLFSPVQSELRSSRQDRILVVDGLENDDWSTYCALTYPDTNVYNLCSSSALWSRKSSEVVNDGKWMPPVNHRRISYADISAPFPFPKGFFTAVVFRFPTANTDYAYRNAIAECKRVLRPGGFLELTILDMDTVNMGNHMSRAIRNLKVRMQAAVPDVSLSPASDEVMKLLGRKGFENISRCVVGVPVTGALSNSRKGSMSQPPSPDREAETGAQLSLGALLTGQARGADLHYPVTKMVARVARWWWSKCYESSILGEPRESIWSHRELLKECEERETGLKLVICYAQKPTSARRRTVSV